MYPNKTFPVQTSVTVTRCVLHYPARLAVTLGYDQVRWCGVPSQVMALLTLKGYTMSPSTRPGVSTKVSRLNFFCLELETSAER